MDKFEFDSERYDDDKPLANELEQQLFRWVAEVAKSVSDEENDDDYIVNPKQSEAFLRVQLYLMKLIRPEDGEWVHAYIESPKHKNGHIAARFVCIDIAQTAKEMINNENSDKVQIFCKMLAESCSLLISSTADGEYVDLELIIPDVFVKKTE